MDAHRDRSEMDGADLVARADGRRWWGFLAFLARRQGRSGREKERRRKEDREK